MTSAFLRTGRCPSQAGIRSGLVACVLAGAILAVAVPSAHAGGDDTDAGSPGESNKKAKAQALVRAASELYMAGKYEEALPLFRQAYELYPSPKIIMNTGSTLAKLGRHAEAANVYQMFLHLPDRDRSKDPEVRAIITRQLAPRLGRLDIAISGGPAEGIVLYIDDQKVDRRDGEPIWVTPGARVVRADGPRFRADPVRVEIAAGKVLEVKLVGQLLPSGPDGDNVTGPDPLTTGGDPVDRSDGGSGRPGRGYRIATWAGVAITATALTVGVVSHIRVARFESDLDEAIVAYQTETQSQLDLDDACGDAETKPAHPLLDDVLAACDGGEQATRITNIAYAGTAVALVLSGFFFYKGYISAPKSEPATRTVEFTPTLTPRVVGAELTVRF